MKSIVVILFSLLAFSGFSKSYYLNVRFSFKNIEDGYDHSNKNIVYIDGEKAGESEVKKESEANAVRVEVPEGNHDIRVENWVLYQGKWELHSKENEYSFDLITTESVNMTHNMVMRLVYDLDTGIDVTLK